MSHPGLESANIHSMPQVLCGKRMTEFVKEVVLAVWTFRAAVAMLGDALSTIQFRPLPGDCPRNHTASPLAKFAIIPPSSLPRLRRYKEHNSGRGLRSAPACQRSWQPLWPVRWAIFE